jgi:hypothetical protein
VRQELLLITDISRSAVFGAGFEAQRQQQGVGIELAEVEVSPLGDVRLSIKKQHVTAMVKPNQHIAVGERRQKRASASTTTLPTTL